MTLGSALAIARQHPILSGILLAGTLGGAVAGGIYCPADWPLARGIAAGALSGLVVGIFCTPPRIIG